MINLSDGEDIPGTEGSTIKITLGSGWYWSGASTIVLTQEHIDKMIKETEEIVAKAEVMKQTDEQKLQEIINKLNAGKNLSDT